MRDDEIIRKLHQEMDSVHVLPDLRRKTLMTIEGKEEPEMKKKLTFSVILAIALVLALTGIAFAATSGFGIMNYHPEQSDNNALKEHIVPVDQDWDGEYFSVSVHEAFFDGTKLSLTMSMIPKENAEPVYVIPRIRATADGRELSVFEQSGTGGYESDGFWIPNMEPGYISDFENIGMDVQISENGLDVQTVRENVDWELSFDVLHPEWPILYTEQDEPCIEEEPWTDQEYEAYEQQFVKAYREKHILLNRAAMLSPFAAAIPHDFSMEEEQAYVDWSENLLTREAFRLTDKIVFQFTTAPLSVKHSKELVQFDLADGIHAELLNMTVSASQISFSIRMTDTEPGKPLTMSDWGNRVFAVLAENANTFFAGGSCGMRDDGSILYRSQCTLTGETDTVIIIPVEDTQANEIMKAQALPEEWQGSAVHIPLE